MNDGELVCELIMAIQGMRERGWVLWDLVRSVNAPSRDVIRLSNDAAALVAAGIRL